MEIFVAKLSFNTTEDELRAAFAAFGEVESVKIIMDQFTGKSKGYAFVEMPNEAEAQKAINELNKTELGGRNIIVKQKEDRGYRERRGGGRYDRRGGGMSGSFKDDIATSEGKPKKKANPFASANKKKNEPSAPGPFKDDGMAK